MHLKIYISQRGGVSFYLFYAVIDGDAGLGIRIYSTPFRLSYSLLQATK